MLSGRHGRKFSEQNALMNGRENFVRLYLNFGLPQGTLAVQSTINLFDPFTVKSPSERMRLCRDDQNVLTASSKTVWLFARAPTFSCDIRKTFQVLAPELTLGRSCPI